MTNDFATRLRAAAYARKDAAVLYATPADKLGSTTPAALDAIEKGIEARLPPEVRSFYLGANDFALIWQEGSGTETTKQPKGWSDVCDTDSEYWSEAIFPSRDLSKRGGMICIPSAAEVFRKGYWIDRIVPEPSGDEIEIDGRAVADRDLYENLYPFDFPTSYYCAGLWHDRQKDSWRVVLGDDFGASWTDYETLSVADYFAQLERDLGGLRTFVSVLYGEKARKEIWALRAET